MFFITSSLSIFNFYMAEAASSPSTKILQFEWFISGRIFPVFPAQGGDFKKPCLCLIKITILDNM